MKRILLLTAFVAACTLGFAQNDLANQQQQNTAQRLLNSNQGLTIGGYGEVHYNQPLNSDTYNNGQLDVHRVVMLFGYNFNEKTQFVTELEFEHVKEVYVEQAFIQHKINNAFQFRGGLMLIPMGIVNEYHEPNTFNGVERPLVDKYIAPTTWREIGAGFTGNILPASIRYQAYVVGGFNGYDGSGKFSGKNGLRKGRQKGAEAYVSSPNFTGKVEYFGIRGLNVGLSGYFGDSQSTLYDGIDKSDKEAVAAADSSTIGMSMIGLDARYTYGGLQLRGQYYYTSLSNTEQYNEFTSSDLGSSLNGLYIEAGYNVFKHLDKVTTDLIPFIRYEQFDTHNKVAGNLAKNDAYDKSAITTGLTWKMTQNAVLKADVQFVKSAADDEFSRTFNAGFGIMF
ncbi:hypothetical protein [Carboxylicivirga sp. M1479]|uniref:hypothetical protein n=1 Tax=Carboxylicivirga sp. M1479 TaxID=2594476 RepID=UPI001177FA89|nr:hypothetical protein [Carboxylicivirga sp. M1479]TRX66509.1 hypothetical protein FNN09_13430 [Carboxylicivirga sp. M1479]